MKFIWRMIRDKTISDYPTDITISKSAFLNSWKNLFDELLQFINPKQMEDTLEVEEILNIFSIEMQ